MQTLNRLYYSLQNSFMLNSLRLLLFFTQPLHSSSKLEATEATEDRKSKAEQSQYSTFFFLFSSNY